MEIALIALAVALAIHFLPTIVASNRGHHQSGAIFVLNLFLGWTLVGGYAHWYGRSQRRTKFTRTFSPTARLFALER